MIWKIALLGRVEVRFGTREVTRFESTRVVALLARLALFPNRIHPREELIELLWPDTEPAVGRNRLRSTLSTLRRQLESSEAEGDLFQVSRHSLRLNPQACTCDVWELEQAIRQKRWNTASALHRGELLPGFYDDWIVTERERLEAFCDDLEDRQDGGSSLETPALESDSVALAPLLPGYLTAFFGRETEKEALIALLRESRLVTLTGSGGIGKTRLSVEVARRLAPEFERCAFVALAECLEPTALLERIRLALGLQGRTVLAEALMEQRTLLILDNFEQLLEGGGGLVVSELLTHLPLLTCLVTSRRTLGVSGEREWALLPLPVPTEAEPGSAALALFVDRARAIRPDFAVTERNQGDLLALARLLEGVPLAIELVASRIRALSLTELSERLTQHFAELARAPLRSHKEERHRSLHATVEWSWRLLSPRLQRFLASLSVFRGGWSATAAVSVCSEPDAAALLEELVADSLVTVTERENGTMRFHLLEMIRSFVEERLDLTRRAELQQAHAAYFLEWCRALGCQWHHMDSELENLRASLDFAVATENAELALRLLRPIRLLLGFRGGAEPSLPVFRRALALSGGAPDLRCLGLLELSALLVMLQERGEARTYFEKARSVAKEAGENPAQELALLRGEIQLAAPRFESPDSVLPLFERALALARQLEERETEANLLNFYGTFALRIQENLEEAEQLFQRSEALYAALDDRLHANYVLLNRANTAMEAGRLPEALERYGQCRQACRLLSDHVLETYVDNSTGTLLSKMGEWDAAKAHLLACLRQAWRLGYRYILGFALLNLPEPLARTGQIEAAASLLGFVESYWPAHHVPFTEEDHEYIHRVQQLCGERLGEAPARFLFGSGSALPLRDAVFLALDPVS
ncbi:MAG: winged helix-turn-helix domain-containing protein [Armatimonas sp.]